jgi:phosphate acetyltransferase
MSAVMDRIRRQASMPPRRLVLPETGDPRIVRAADRLASRRLAEITLLGPLEEARATARRVEAGLSGVRLRDGSRDGLEQETAAVLRELRGDRLSDDERRRLSRDPLFQAAALVRADQADCFVAGASRATAEVLRAALWLIGTRAGVKTVSSFFLMDLPGTAERVLFFADCGVVPDPDAAQLAEIGVATADSFARLTGQVPHVAFLSYSTRGSADHPRVTKVREAVERARALRPDLHLDGELQVDAALVPEVAERKAPGSTVAGHANVLVFPDLDAGNIGYKLVQRLAGAKAYGPILQGLARQANDLSRGCSAEDVVEVATIACALAGAGREARR